jgi:HSP20 family molecular chaperone IbpA
MLFMLRLGFGDNMRDMMSVFNDDFFEPVKYMAGINKAMRTDVRETEDSYILDIEVPGFKKEDIKIELKDGGYLVVSATKDETVEEKNKEGKVIHVERNSGSCSRSFYVGEDVKIADIKAKFENGELSISYPKEVEKVEQKDNFISID